MSMELGCIEVVVNRRKNTKFAFLQVLLIVVCVLGALLGMGGAWPFLILAVAAGVGAYFAGIEVNVDWEYSLVDRELRIAKILNKSRRKAVGNYDLEKLEILAQHKSYQLDSFKNRTDKELDFSSKDPEDDNFKFILFIPGNRMILTIKGEEGNRLLSAIRQFAPRKVFLA